MTNDQINSVAAQVLSAMRRARQPGAYGSSYANSMNEDIAREVARDICRQVLVDAPASPADMTKMEATDVAP
jgi:hypothetical protein